MEVETEVPIGSGVPRGWIDLLAYREADAALATFELKTDLPDVGGLQRQVSWYERAAPWAARRLGWRPERFVVAVVCLDTQAVADRPDEHRSLLRATLPGGARALAAWLEDPAATIPRGWSLAVTDLTPRRSLALAPSRLDGRRSPPAYRNYADAAAHLRSPGVRQEVLVNVGQVGTTRAPLQSRGLKQEFAVLRQASKSSLDRALLMAIIAHNQ